MAELQPYCVRIEIAGSIRRLKEQPNDIEIERFNETILLNTVNGLSGDFEGLNDGPLIYSESPHYSQISLIEKIINHILDKEIEEYPAIVYNTSDTFRVFKSQEFSVYKI